MPQLNFLECHLGCDNTYPALIVHSEYACECFWLFGRQVIFRHTADDVVIDVDFIHDISCFSLLTVPESPCQSTRHNTHYVLQAKDLGREKLPFITKTAGFAGQMNEV